MFRTNAAGKRAAVLLLAGLLCIGLSGCHPLHHSRKEVRSYIGSSVRVSWLPQAKLEGIPILGDTWRWRCHYADMPQVVFYVSDYWSLVDGFELFDNEEDVFWKYYLNQYLSESEGSLDAWEIREAYGNQYLKLDFASMEQAYRAAEQLQAFCDWLNQQPHSPSRWITFQLTGPLPVWRLEDSDSVCTSGTVIYHDSYAETTGKMPYDVMADRCATILMEYYAFYNLPCPGCTPEDVRSYALKAWPWDGEWGYDYPDAVQYGGEELPLDTFAGIGMERGFVSYGGFYDMLSLLGVPTQGAPEHFSFTGADGCRYEFSYEFFEETDEESLWYFTRDGEHLTSGAAYLTDGAPLLSLEDERLQDMAGLQFIYE